MIPFCRISWEIWKEGGNMLKKIVGWFGLINFVVFITVFKRPKKKYEYVKYDCAIVCGYPANNDGKPSKIMKSRVDKAIELYNEGKVKFIIFSGGSVKNKYKEADIMENYALELGIEQNVIFKEDKSMCTYHNLMYTKKIMDTYNLKNCLVITNSWHLRKADHYARKFKLDHAMVSAQAPKSYSCLKIIILHISTNFKMYCNLFKGYY